MIEIFQNTQNIVYMIPEVQHLYFLHISAAPRTEWCQYTCNQFF